MSFSLFPIAYAAAATGAPEHVAANGLSSIFLLVGFVVIFYFLLWRPQSKRAKEQRDLVSSLAKGDEVVTSGGILGKITKIADNYITVAIAEGVEILVQKNAVALTLPKGTMKDL
jgi:preprotein translocase subunit YajC